MNMGSSQSGMASCAYVSHMHHKLPVDLVMKAITLGRSLASDEHWAHEKYLYLTRDCFGIFTDHKMEQVMVMILSPFF